MEGEELTRDHLEHLLVLVGIRDRHEISASPGTPGLGILQVQLVTPGTVEELL